ncbi:hypothetical protein D3C77_660010 [compost metagenome]
MAYNQSMRTTLPSSVTFTDRSVLAGSTGEVSSTAEQPGIRSSKSTRAWYTSMIWKIGLIAVWRSRPSASLKASKRNNWWSNASRSSRRHCCR